MNENTIKNIFEDEALVKELLTLDSAEAVQAKLEDNGYSLSIDEINLIGETLQKIASGELTQEQIEAAADGELNEDDLEQVSGGIALATVGAIIVAIGGSTAAGAALYTAVESVINIRKW